MRTRITLECTECKQRNYNMTKDKKKSEKKAQKTSWFQGMKSEFKKVIWPDKKTLAKQTAAVVSVSVFLGALISVIDVIVKYGIDLLVK